jgi:nucleotide-binding universal stress UspA family protein
MATPLVSRVLVAVEPSDDDASLLIAHRIASAFGASLEALQIVPSAGWPDNDPTMVRVENGATVQELERRVAERTGRPSNGLRATVLRGDPASSIVSHAKEQRCDLIVVGTHGRTGVERLVLGSVAESVIGSAPCPVLVARSAAPSEGGILAGCDLAVRMDPVITLAGAVGQALSSPLTLLHGVEPNMSDAALVASTFFSGVVPTQPDVETVDAMKEAALGALRAELDAVNLQGKVEVGNGPASALLLARARELPASVIVVGSHHRGRVARLLLGSVANEVVRGAEAHVLVVR